MSADILRELTRAKVAFQMRALRLVMGLPASCDTRPQGGDSEAAPFTSGAVPAQQEDALTPSSQKDNRHD